MDIKPLLETQLLSPLRMCFPLDLTMHPTGHISSTSPVQQDIITEADVLLHTLNPLSCSTGNIDLS